jgi:hypothetical protein
MVMVTCALVSRAALASNVPIPTRGEAMQRVRMQDMHWMPTLTPEQVADVRLALASPYYPTVEAALTNAILHRLYDLVPVIEGVVRTPSTAGAQPFHKVCADVLKSRGDPFEELRHMLIAELPGDEFLPMREKLVDFRPVRDMITFTIVAHEVRAVRAGEKGIPSVEGLQLSLFENELVSLSPLESGCAVGAILDRLSDVPVITPRQTALIQVLHTYPADTYVPSVLAKLEGQSESKGYGTTLLLQSLRFHCDKVSDQSKARLHSIIESLQRTNPTGSLCATLSALDLELRPGP